MEVVCDSEDVFVAHTVLEKAGTTSIPDIHLSK